MAKRWVSFMLRCVGGLGDSLRNAKQSDRAQGPAMSEMEPRQGYFGRNKEDVFVLAGKS